MSYQPDPPAQYPSPFAVPGAPPPTTPVPQYQYGYAPTVPVAAAPAPGGRRKGLLLTGIAVAVLGIGAGVALVALSGSAKEKTVKSFARAPVGCTTTLEFDKTATFTIYIETKGTIGSVAGDCQAGGTSYLRTNGQLPGLTLTLLNSNNEAAVLTPTTTPTYSVGSFAGQGYQRVNITAPGTYRLTVSSDDTDFAIAVGGKPDADAAGMLAAGGGAVAVGVLLGGLLILLGLRRTKVTPPPMIGSSQAWQPVPGAPVWPTQPTMPGAPSAYPTAPPAPLTPTAPTPTAPTPPAPTPPAPTAPPAGPGWGAPQL
ncbi:MAG TPA: hypothetical protein PK020_08360 [Ilumatobacteraceae bacterium]|nr:hypothetical protein [Ilumatobacteraceae bacterium]HRB02473.1 hypothetical protein [Ilumatobacteraceae bacterium]